MKAFIRYLLFIILALICTFIYLLLVILIMPYIISIIKNTNLPDEVKFICFLVIYTIIITLGGMMIIACYMLIFDDIR